MVPRFLFTSVSPYRGDWAGAHKATFKDSLPPIIGGIGGHLHICSDVPQYKDPDGNSLETQVDTFDTPEEATVFMKSKEFADNPIGTDIDPVCCPSQIAPAPRFAAVSKGYGCNADLM
jgi:hypothetical protein